MNESKRNERWRDKEKKKKSKSRAVGKPHPHYELGHLYAPLSDPSVINVLHVNVT